MAREDRLNAIDPAFRHRVRVAVRLRRSQWVATKFVPSLQGTGAPPIAFMTQLMVVYEVVMVAIMMAALFGAGASTLLLAKFGLPIALLAIPFGGSAAGMAAALGLAAARDRRLQGRAGEPRAVVRSLPLAR